MNEKVDAPKAMDFNIFSCLQEIKFPFKRKDSPDFEDKIQLLLHSSAHTCKLN